MSERQLTEQDVTASRQDRDGWTAIEILLPIPGDLMVLTAFARIEGNRLLEWTTQPPVCFPVFSPPPNSLESIAETNGASPIA